MADDELVEALDDDGNVVRVVTRAEMRAQRLRHRCVFLLVVDRGRLLVHQRADDKDVWPSRWDVAAGGVVGAGERWEDAARRELAEELGIDADPVHVGEGVRDGDEARVVGRVFLVEHPGPFSFADGEVVDARFVDRRELLQLLDTEATCPDSVAIALPYVLTRLA